MFFFFDKDGCQSSKLSVSLGLFSGYALRTFEQIAFACSRCLSCGVGPWKPSCIIYLFVFHISIINFMINN